jgi:UDP-N-acetylglucosamine acyltransferase
MVNNATLGGHVEIGDRVTVGGMTAVHQFSRIGEYSFIGGMSGISMDVPPYVIVTGIRKDMRVSGINKVGLKRCGFANDTIKKLDKAYKIIFMTPALLLQEALDQALAEFPDCDPVSTLVDFFRTSKQGVVRKTNGN